MFRYRLTQAAQGDILTSSPELTSSPARSRRRRYESLIVAALRDVASHPDRRGSLARPELGAGVRSWHLRLSREHMNPRKGVVRRPRHFLVHRTESGFVVSRVLHDAMELARHMDPDTSWE